MHYTLYSCSTRQPIDSVEMHVLARAYRSAWRSLWASDPAGPHLVNALDLIIDFGRPPPLHPAPALRRTR
jgi:CelD/BcsL family acetyltransferase involved in cellulose biosynthesis